MIILPETSAFFASSRCSAVKASSCLARLQPAKISVMPSGFLGCRLKPVSDVNGVRRALPDVGLACRGRANAAIQIVGVKRVDVSNTSATSPPVVVIAPSGIDGFIGIVERNARYQGRLVIAAAQDLGGPLRPTKESDALAVGRVIDRRSGAERDGFTRQMDFAIAGQAFDRPSRLRVAVIIDLCTAALDSPPRGCRCGRQPRRHTTFCPPYRK